MLPDVLSVACVHIHSETEYRIWGTLPTNEAANRQPYAAIRSHSRPFPMYRGHWRKSVPNVVAPPRRDKCSSPAASLDAPTQVPLKRHNYPCYNPLLVATLLFQHLNPHMLQTVHEHSPPYICLPRSPFLAV